ncbi:cadherin-like domain-containing protein, partial [Leptospira interrogans]
DVVDEHGARAAQTAAITISGTNDAPVAAGDNLDAIQLEDAGFSYNSANGHWYRFEGVAKNWFDARDAAAVGGGYLATVTTAQENQFIWDHIDAAHPGSVTSTGLPINPAIEPIVNRSMWIGGSDSATEGVWNWQTGPEAGQVFWDNGSATSVYSNWLPGEPSNTAGLENHVIFYADNGIWYDYQGGNLAAGYVVEIGGRSGDGAFADEDTPRSFAASRLLANDTDVDDGAVLNVTSVSATSAKGATITLADGQITYDPHLAQQLQALAAGEMVTDTFTYTVSDGLGGTSTAEVMLTVTGSNDAPVGANPDPGVWQNDPVVEPVVDYYGSGFYHYDAPMDQTFAGHAAEADIYVFDFNFDPVAGTYESTGTDVIDYMQLGSGSASSPADYIFAHHYGPSTEGPYWVGAVETIAVEDMGPSTYEWTLYYGSDRSQPVATLGTLSVLHTDLFA